jgi:hypothetical protein
MGNRYIQVSLSLKAYVVFGYFIIAIPYVGGSGHNVKIIKAKKKTTYS